MKDAAASKLLANPNIDNLDQIELLDKEDLVEMVKRMVGGGVSLSFYGKRTASEIEKRVKPRQTQIVRKLSIGTEAEQKDNALIEGENLQALVTLYKYRGQVDLVLTDPPYNTGEDFRYNDKWDKDPNDPDLGLLVAKDDGARHTKWMKAMLPRLKMMKAMLKPSGVIAICIDHRELYRLGMLMDEVFREENRIGIINWQKSYAPKSDTGGKKGGLSTATEYILVYAKESEQAKTGMLDRTESMDAKYANPDNDPLGDWRYDNPSAPSADTHQGMVYAIQSPFTGQLYYPSEGRCWAFEKPQIKHWLEAWGSKYEEVDLQDGKRKALVLKGATYKVSTGFVTPSATLKKASTAALRKQKKGPWAKLYFGLTGQTGPQTKRYFQDVKKGKIPMTFWADEDYDSPTLIESQSWEHAESGHSQTGVNELTSIVGKGHGFETVKPLRLFKKIVQLWCPNDGLVLDPYAGSGTTGHAVLEMNHEVEGSERRFILIEQGAPEKGDKYAKTLTYRRLKRAITGERVNKSGKVVKSAPRLEGGFRFQLLKQAVDANAVLAMKKDELIDIVIVSHWDDTRRRAALERIDDPSAKFLVGKNDSGNGYFVIWNGGDAVESFTKKAYETIVKEAQKHKLVSPYYVYARNQIYQSRTVVFHKIPDKILAHLGLNESSDSYNLEEEED